MQTTNRVREELELMEIVLTDQNTYDANKLEIIETILNRLLHE